MKVVPQINWNGVVQSSFTGWTGNGFMIPAGLSWCEFWRQFGASTHPEILEGKLFWVTEKQPDDMSGAWTQFNPFHTDRLIELMTAENLGCSVGGLAQ